LDKGKIERSRCQRNGDGTFLARLFVYGYDYVYDDLGTEILIVNVKVIVNDSYDLLCLKMRFVALLD